jgi:hypothetical protein
MKGAEVLRRLRALGRSIWRFVALGMPSVILWFLSGSARLGVSWILLTVLGAVIFQAIGLHRLLRWIDWISLRLPFGRILLGPLLRSARIAAEVLPAVSHPDIQGGLYRRIALLLEEACQ